jgi:hypothetical protein
VHQLWTASRAAGVTLGEFVRPLSGQPSKYVRQLQQAQQPGPRTIERVQALIAGRPVPAPQSRVLADPGIRPAAEQIRENIEWRRALAETAAVERRPGETLHAAVQRLSQELRAA